MDMGLSADLMVKTRTNYQHKGHGSATQVQAAMQGKMVPFARSLLAALNARKRAAVAREDFQEAKRVKKTAEEVAGIGRRIQTLKDLHRASSDAHDQSRRNDIDIMNDDEIEEHVAVARALGLVQTVLHADDLFKEGGA